jgi:hypothetical protein
MPGGLPVGSGPQPTFVGRAANGRLPPFLSNGSESISDYGASRIKRLFCHGSTASNPSDLEAARQMISHCKEQYGTGQH